MLIRTQAELSYDKQDVLGFPGYQGFHSSSGWYLQVSRVGRILG